MQRDLGRLRECPDTEEQAGRDDRRAVVAEHAMDLAERLQEVNRARVVEDHERPDHQPHVSDHVDHERLQPGSGRGVPAIPVRDQQVRGRAHERPADDQQEEIAGQHQQQHREHEVVQVAEVAREPAVHVHVGDRVQVDERGHAGDHEDHEHRQRVNQDRDRGVDADAVVVAPQRGGVLARVSRVAQQRDQGRDRKREREPDRRRTYPAGAAPGPSVPAQRDREGPHERAQEHQPGAASHRAREALEEALAALEQHRLRPTGRGGRWMPVHPGLTGRLADDGRKLLLGLRLGCHDSFLGPSLGRTLRKRSER